MVYMRLQNMLESSDRGKLRGTCYFLIAVHSRWTWHQFRLWFAACADCWSELRPLAAAQRTLAALLGEKGF